MRKILIALTVILAACSQDDSTCSQMQLNVALQMNCATKISSCRHFNPSSAMTHTIFNGLVHGLVVESLTIAFGTIITYVIIARMSYQCHKEHACHQQSSHIQSFLKAQFDKSQWMSFYLDY